MDIENSQIVHCFHIKLYFAKVSYPRVSVKSWFIQGIEVLLFSTVAQTKVPWDIVLFFSNCHSKNKKQSPIPSG